MPGAEPQKLELYRDGEEAPGMLCHCCGKVYAGTFFYTRQLGVICSNCWSVLWSICAKCPVPTVKQVAHLFVVLEHQFGNDEIRDNILSALVSTAEYGENVAIANLAIAEYNRKINQKYYSKEKPNAPA